MIEIMQSTYFGNEAEDVLTRVTDEKFFSTVLDNNWSVSREADLPIVRGDKTMFLASKCLPCSKVLRRDIPITSFKMECLTP